MSTSPKATVIVFPGSNGDRDLAETFTRAGFDASYLPSDQALPPDSQVVGLPGGFSYGDYWRAGMLASQAQAVQGLVSFVQQGGLVIGICNGFQILVESGFLPGGLRYNDPPGFRHRWVRLRATACRPSPWLHGIPKGTTLSMPMAHGEGNYFHPDGPEAVQHSAPFVYEQNPNGSMGHAAAMLDPSGRVLGIMPHPERASEPDLGSDDGLEIFRAAHRWLQEPCSSDSRGTSRHASQQGQSR